MPIDNKAILAFNRGILSALGLARLDLKRYPFAAEIQKNWMPRAIGSMMFRPGLGWLDNTYNDQPAFHLPFIFSLNDTAIIEITNQLMRVRVNEQIITRVAVATTITNGSFSGGDLSGWVNQDEAGATSEYDSGFMSLRGNNISRAIRSQSVSVAPTDIGKEHALRIVVNRGNVILRVGTSSGDDSYISETTLAPGTHSLAFTPTTTFYIQVTNATQYRAFIASFAIEAVGPMTITSPWLTADLGLIRLDQSADVLFVSCDGYGQYKIERRGTRSWSVVKFLADDGPFLLDNADPSILLTPSAINGDITIASSVPYFKSTQVDGLIRITSVGQLIQATPSGSGQFSDPVRITGIGSQRNFNIAISGTWVGTLTLQRSVGDIGAWIDVNTYTTNTSTTYGDGLDNQIIYYRIGFKTGDYTSGTANISMSYSSGGLTGIARITGFNNSQSVNAAVLKAFGATAGSSDWSEGQWSTRRGFPTTTLLDEGRLWWFGRDKINASVSDAFASHDDTVTGDSGPISRSIGSGPVDRINWALALLRLGMGGEMAEHFAFSNSLDEPMTPTNFNIRAPSNKGSAPIQAVKHDNEAIFVDKSGTRLYTVAYDNLYQRYINDDLTVFCPDLLLAGVKKIAIQFQPDVRIHAVMNDGSAFVLVYDKVEEVKAWIEVETQGLIEDVLVMPGLIEDKVYYTVNRTIQSATRRHFERWAMETECVGATLNKQADSFGIFTSVSLTNTITGADHLEGEQVVVWGDGKDFSPTSAAGVQTLFTVTGGHIVLPSAISNAVYGLPYDGQYRSTKLAYAAALSTALTQMKTINSIGLILKDTHAKGVRYGRSFAFNELNDMPEIDDGTTVDPNKIWDQYDNDMIEFDGDWSTDERVCLYAQAPRPCTALGLVVGMSTNDTT